MILTGTIRHRSDADDVKRIEVEGVDYAAARAVLLDRVPDECRLIVIRAER